MKRIIFLFIAAGLFLAVGSGSALADQIKCESGYTDCNAACAAVGGSCISESCSWSNSCPSGSVSLWCVDGSWGSNFCSAGRGWAGAFCKCAAGPPPCTPSSCSSLGKNCGSWSDGCGGTLNCGSCSGGQLCSSSGNCYTPCYPKTSCSSGKNCGTEPDGCGGNVNCGSCSGGQVCYGSPSGACADPRWVATGTDLSVCASRDCYSPSSCNNDGTCAYSASPAGTSCSGGRCYVGSCDTSPPVTGISLNPAVPNGINGWYVSQVASSVTCSDVGSGCNKITYTTNNGAHWYDASAYSTPFTYNLNLGDGTYYVKAYSTDKATLVGTTVQAPVFPIKVDTSAPSVSVTGAPSIWQNSDASAGVGCSDSGSGCGTYGLKTYSSNPGSCSSDYNQYPLAPPQAISSHIWVCAAAKDVAGNAGFSSPVEFKVDKIPPQVKPYGVPFAPCTINPVDGWIDCSATSSLDSSPPNGCADADSGCNPSSYGFISYYSNPGTCPASKSSYSGKAPVINNVSWVCGYAEDYAGNTKVSSPTKFMVNRTFTIVVNAKAYGEIDVPAGTEVKGYLCEPSQYYCNQDAQNLASGSGIVGADKKFKITFVRELVRGTEYKVGLQTEKGYAETGFVA